MGKKLVYILCVLGLLLGLNSCSDSNNALSSSGSAVMYLATAGDAEVAAFTVNLGSGSLSSLTTGVSTGTSPVAMALSPLLSALFIANSNSNDISTYTVNSDGSLTAATATTKVGTTPIALAMDPAGKFLFVANQGSSDISVFSVSGSTLTEVAGSPFTTIPAGQTDSTGPSGLVVSLTGNFLYVSNSTNGTVAAYSIDSSGVIAPSGPLYTVGTAPTGMTITPGGPFLYVVNSGSNTVSAFSICDKVVTSCADPNNPDGRLTVIPGTAANNAFAVGQSPIAVAADPSFAFLYVLNKGSNQISCFSYGSGTGVLTALTTPVVSTGATPVSFVIVAGATGTNRGNTTTNPIDYVYVANNGSSTITPFTLTTATGVLAPFGTTITTATNPSAIAAN